MLRNLGLSRKSLHSWKFVRIGGFDQVRLDSGADLLALEQLDQKLWVALACPTHGLEFDARTLDLMDIDRDGRIRAPEILAAVKWACGCLKNPDELLQGAVALPLASIQDGTPEGRQLLASARQVLVNLGQGDSPTITVDDVADTARIFAQTTFNGDGIIPVESAEDPAMQAVIRDLLACLTPQTDRSGKPGVNHVMVDQFFAEAGAFSDWWAKAEADAAVLPLGPATSAAAAVFQAVRAKIDDYFARCRLAAFDTRAVAALNRQESEYLALAAQDLTVTSAEIAALPLSRIEARQPLPLAEGVNPAWAGPLADFQKQVVTPLLGKRDVLTEADWAEAGARFAAYEAWAAGKPAGVVEKLGLPRVREILAGPGKAAVTALIVKDQALEPEANAIAAVERLVRYYRDLYRLLNNFVSYRDFYGRRDKAVFQAGRLYLDQRSCDLCVRVDDMGKHATMAPLSQIYLAYCECVRKTSGEKMTVAAAFTAGDSDNLMIGRNGVFYDRLGRDWDATVVKIVDNPISIRQAFWSPYKRTIRWVQEQAAKRAAAADTAATARLQTAAVEVGTTAETGKPPEKKSKIDVGTVAALGVGLGAIATVIGGFVAGLMGLTLWKMALALLGLMLLISTPSMIIAWLKLRQRNLGPILDANGWAVNARARINIPFGRSLTAVAVLPPGSRRDLLDPYAESKKGRNWTIIALILAVLVWAAWFFGGIERVLPDLFPTSRWYDKRHPPATQPTSTTLPPAPATQKS